mmetsp:Transcript_10647/g.23433  ORF Transcript_10647/g.23433 Transcript_10647/m.23433 type:complete len:96 (+) Transcript_10647:82-369(+)
MPTVNDKLQSFGFGRSSTRHRTTPLSYGGSVKSDDDNSFDIICELSSLLNVEGLDKTGLRASMDLIAAGADPTVLATLVKETVKERNDKKKQGGV